MEESYNSVMSTALPQYLEWLTVHQFSPSLLEGRQKHLRQFIDWCEVRAVTRFSQVTRGHCERFQRWLFYYRKKNGKPLGVTTQFARLISLRAFFKWAARYHVIDVNPAAELLLPRMPERIPRMILSPREVEMVLNQPDVTDVYGLRDRAMMEVLYSTGIRRAELCRLLLHDVDQDRGTLMVREGKGRRDRVVPIGQRALDWVDKYLRDARPQLVMEPDVHMLFVSRTGGALYPDPLSALVSKYVLASEIGKRGSCHLFRHAMATAMLDNGADIRFIQALLGHRALDTTAMYTRVAVGQLKEIHSATHPAESKAAAREERSEADDVLAEQWRLRETLDEEAVEEDAAVEVTRQVG